MNFYKLTFIRLSPLYAPLRLKTSGELLISPVSDLDLTELRDGLDRRNLLQKVVLHRKQGCPRSRGNAGLVIDMLNMAIDCFFGNDQRRRHLLDAQAA